VTVESITFSLQYTNTNWVSLHNAEIVLSYPKGFHPEVKAGWTAADTRLTIPVGNISSRTVGRIDVTGRFFGSKGDLLFLDATLRYEPSQMSEIFSYDTRFGVTISTAPIVLEADAPKMAATGDTVEYVVHYENTEGGTFSNIRVKGTYPDTFQFVSASPAPSEGKDTWYIGDLAGKTSGTIHVTGTLSGDRNEVKSVSFSIGYPSLRMEPGLQKQIEMCPDRYLSREYWKMSPPRYFHNAPHIRRCRPSQPSSAHLPRAR
jgi:uncharacterized repeat protein (TIGR01451 family)